MHGKDWMQDLEKLHPGMLSRLFRVHGLSFSTTGDSRVAEILAPLAKADGASITANVVAKARQAAGLTRQPTPKPVPLAQKHIAPPADGAPMLPLGAPNEEAPKLKRMIGGVIGRVEKTEETLQEHSRTLGRIEALLLSLTPAPGAGDAGRPS